MNSTEATEPEQPRNQSVNRPTNLLSDWRIAVLILFALWGLIYMVGLSTPALLDDADTVHAEAARERSEEHTSELQSPCNLVCRLLLEKKKKKMCSDYISKKKKKKKNYK